MVATDQLTELVRAHVAAVREREQLRHATAEAITTLIAKTDRQYSDDEARRCAELKAMQRAFYVIHLADLLRNDPENYGGTDADLLSKAEDILQKKDYQPGRNLLKENRRTLRERQYVGSVRVRWHALMKAAGARAIDARGSSRTTPRDPGNL